ncbi:hypothetical protein BH23ACT11_BH23ACT11_16020 [soil metagenome]
MKFSYYPETDTLYIDLLERPGTDVLELATDFVVDVDADGTPVGIEVEHASERTDLTRLEVAGLRLELGLDATRESKAG